MSKGIYQLIADLTLLPSFNQTRDATYLAIIEKLLDRINVLEERIEILENVKIE